MQKSTNDDLYDQFLVACFHFNLPVLSTFDYTLDVVTLAEKCEPIVKDLLLLVCEVVPFRNTVLFLER